MTPWNKSTKIEISVLVMRAEIMESGAGSGTRQFRYGARKKRKEGK